VTPYGTSYLCQFDPPRLIDVEGGAIGRSTNRTRLVLFRFRVGKLTNVQRTRHIRPTRSLGLNDTVMAEQVSSLIACSTVSSADTTRHVAEISSLSRCKQQMQSSPRSATSVNPSAEAIFWTKLTFVFTRHGREDDMPTMPMQAAPRIKRASTVQDEHVAARGLLGRVMARLRGH
jgi:hypothetical protein